MRWTLQRVWKTTVFFLLVWMLLMCAVSVGLADCSHPSTTALPFVMPTCTESGLTEGLKCAVCGAVLTPQTRIAPLGHSYVENTTYVEPTCTQSGGTKTICQCTRCGDSFTVSGQDTPALGHNYVATQSNTEPTCTQSGGRKTIYTCSRCGDSYSENSGEIPALGHNYVVTDSVDIQPTCTQTGMKKTVYTCSRCGNSYSDNNGTIPALGHNYTVSDSTDVEPTCTQPGMKKRVYRCTRCGDSYSDNNGTIPALGHNYVVSDSTGTEPTCTEKGMKKKLYRCTRCGDSYTTNSEEVPALGHNYAVSESIDVAPSCTEKGRMKKVYRCTRCGYSYTSNSEEIAALGHDYVASGSTDSEQPSCTKGGAKKIQYRCTRCGDTYTKEESDESLAPIGFHTYKIAENAATCTNSGTITFVCVRCGDTFSCSMTLDHHPVEIPGKEPTCAKDGYSSEIICARCGAVLQEGEILPALNHAFVLDKETATFTCSRCGMALIQSSDGLLDVQPDADQDAFADDENPLSALENEPYLDCGFVLTKDFIRESISQGVLKMEFLFDGGSLIINLDGMQREPSSNFSDAAIDAYEFTLDIKNQEYQIVMKAISRGAALSETVLTDTNYDWFLLQKD